MVLASSTAPRPTWQQILWKHYCDYQPFVIQNYRWYLTVSELVQLLGYVLLNVFLLFFQWPGTRGTARLRLENQDERFALVLRLAFLSLGRCPYRPVVPSWASLRTHPRRKPHLSTVNEHETFTAHLPVSPDVPRIGKVPSLVGG